MTKLLGDERMRYTRYDLKKKQSSNKYIIIVLIIILAVALFIGTAMSKLLLKNNKYLNVTSSNETNSITSKTPKSSEYVFIQGGIFSKKEYADELMNELSKIGSPIEINENGKIRVIFGLYKRGSTYTSAVKLLTDNKFDNSEISYNIKIDDTCNSEIAGIIDANLQIMSKLNDKDVKSVQTAALKKWKNNLKKPQGNYKNKKVLEELKNSIDKLPASYSKNNTNDSIQFMYCEFKKISK